MSDLTNYAENQLLDAFIAASADYYLALFTTSPGETGTGTEVAGGGYARQVIPFGPVSGNTVTINASMTFPRATAPWGTVTHVGIMDAAVGGTMWWWKALSAGIAVGAGRTITLGVGDLALQME